MVRFLELMRPINGMLPEIQKPDNKVSFSAKCLWTGLSLFVFLICCQVPLYGVTNSAGVDPLYWARVILASNKGSLMELGTTPLITSSMIMTLMAGAKLIDMDVTLADDKALFNTAQKLFGLLITFGEAIAYVISGAYGVDLNFITKSLIVAQLTGSGLLVMMLDELLTKGYGMGSGISLFMCCNICESVFWRAFSPTTINTGKGTEFEGAIVSLFHLMSSKESKVEALRIAFYRETGPNMMNLMATVLVFLMVLYFSGYKIDLPLKHQKMRGAESALPIKLFYTSNVPIILQTALVAQVNFVSQLLYRKFRDNPFVNIIGQWQDLDVGGLHSLPIGGIAYYISPPRNMADIRADPFHAVVYVVFVLASCAMFSKAWLDVSGQSAKDIAKHLRNSQMSIKGYEKESIYSVLNRYIPTAALLGGMMIGALTLVADFLGALGSGTGILLAISILHTYYETLQKEYKDNAIV